MQPLPAVGDVVAEKYRLLRELGRGGMGAVFEGEHLVTGKRVAIKCQIPHKDATADDLQRFLREARAAALVSHPNIVDVYDVGEASGTLFLVMQLLSGVPLGAVLGRPLPVGSTVRTLVCAMRGVQAAHRKGVIHRDLKPDNIFLCHDDEGAAIEPKVLDFGIAKVHAHGDSLSLTQSGAVMGTPHYMSPEQAQDSRRVDARTDVYALGVILYEMLSGERPFQAPSLTALLLRVARGDAKPLRELRPDVPPKLEAVVARAMAVEPDVRFASVAELIEALSPFAGPSLLPALRPPVSTGLRPDTETPLAVASHAPRTARGQRGARLIALSLIALLLLLFGVWSRRRAEVATPAAPEPARAAAAASPKSEPLAPAGVAAPAPSTPAPRPSALAPEPAPTASAPVQGSAPHTATAGARARPRPVATQRAPASQSVAAPAPPRPVTPAPVESTRTPQGRLRVDLTKDQF